MMKIFGYFRRNNVFHPSKRPHELLDNLLKNRSLKQYRLRSEEPCSLQRGRHSTATNNSVKHFFRLLKPKDEAHRQVAYLTATVNHQLLRWLLSNARYSNTVTDNENGL